MQSLRSPVRGLRAKKHNLRNDLNNKRTKAYRLHAEEVQKALKDWEKHLNSIRTDPAPVFVENNVDLEGPPQVNYTPSLTCSYFKTILVYYYILAEFTIKEQQQQQPFNGLCSRTTRVGRY